MLWQLKIVQRWSKRSKRLTFLIDFLIFNLLIKIFNVLFDLLINFLIKNVQNWLQIDQKWLTSSFNRNPISTAEFQSDRIWMSNSSSDFESSGRIWFDNPNCLSLTLINLCSLWNLPKTNHCLNMLVYLSFGNISFLLSSFPPVCPSFFLS